MAVAPFRRQYAVVQTTHRRAPPPLNSSSQDEANKTPPSHFRQPILEIGKFRASRQLPFLHRRNFAVRWSLGRGPPPLCSRRPDDSNKTPHGSFRQRLIYSNYSSRRRLLRATISPPCQRTRTPDHHRWLPLVEANLTRHPSAIFVNILPRSLHWTPSSVAPPFLLRTPAVPWGRPTNLLVITWRTLLSAPISALCNHQKCPHQPSTRTSFLRSAVNSIEPTWPSLIEQPPYINPTCKIFLRPKLPSPAGESESDSKILCGSSGLAICFSLVP